MDLQEVGGGCGDWIDLVFAIPKCFDIYRIHKYQKLKIIMRPLSEVACWPLIPKFADSNPAEAVGFLKGR
jgi:hypothetical protein